MPLQILTCEFSMSGRNELRLAAVDGDALVGVCNVANAGRIAATLCQLYVAPEHRGKGIGTALVSAACAEAGKRGAVAVSAIVEADGPSGFWCTLGFIPVHCEGKNTLVSKQLG